MSLVLSETLVLAKTRSQDLKSVLNFNCWGSGIKDISLVRQLVNVEVIGLSCNEITTLEDFAYCSKLKELILRKNNIKSISEIAHLQNLPKLTNLWLGENPCAETTYNYRKIILKALPNLTMLDNIPVTKEELREIEELGNDIYEEVQYETNSNSSGSGPSSSSNNYPDQQQQLSNGKQPSVTHINEHHLDDQQQQHDIITDQYNNINLADNHNHQDNVTNNHDHHSHVNPNQSILNDSNYSSSYRLNQNNFRNSNTHSISNTHHHHQPHSRCLSLQGSVTTLSGPTTGSQNQSWSNNNNNNNITANNNNIIPPRGGKSHTGNILSAVLCLVKELDYTSCEVVQTALNCRMEETSQ